MKKVTHDSCVINREQLSLREKDLKAKLFGTAANGFQPIVTKPVPYTEDMARKKAKTLAAQQAQVG